MAHFVPAPSRTNTLDIGRYLSHAAFQRITCTLSVDISYTSSPSIPSYLLVARISTPHLTFPLYEPFILRTPISPSSLPLYWTIAPRASDPDSSCWDVKLWFDTGSRTQGKTLLKARTDVRVAGWPKFDTVRGASFGREIQPCSSSSSPFGFPTSSSTLIPSTISTSTSRPLERGEDEPEIVPTRSTTMTSPVTVGQEGPAACEQTDRTWIFSIAGNRTVTVSLEPLWGPDDCFTLSAFLSSSSSSIDQSLFASYPIRLHPANLHSHQPSLKDISFVFYTTSSFSSPFAFAKSSTCRLRLWIVYKGHEAFCVHQDNAFRLPSKSQFERETRTKEGLFFAIKGCAREWTRPGEDDWLPPYPYPTPYSQSQIQNQNQEQGEHEHRSSEDDSDSSSRGSSSTPQSLSE